MMNPEEVGRALGGFPDWRPGFAGATLQAVVRVRDLRGGRHGYYLAIFERSVETDDLTRPVITGIAMFDVDERDNVGNHIATQGVRDMRSALPRFLTASEVRDAFHDVDLDLDHDTEPEKTIRLTRECVVSVGPTMGWRPCEQSRSPFMPFYEVRVRIPELPSVSTVFLRSDGQVFGELTESALGS